jgi:hypothetical protein
MPRSLLLVLATAAAALLLAAPSHATTTPKKAMWGPVEVDGQSQFPIYNDLGVGIFQDSIRWDQVAPTKPVDASNPDDPAYDWPPEIDEAVQQAGKYGMQVSIVLIDTPPWANGNQSPIWAPNNPKDFATFAAAAAKRYPKIHHWMIWSEPSKALNFQPLEPDNGQPLSTKAQLVGPQKYAEMLDASYGALKKVSKANLVIGGNTFTVGTVAPLNWVKVMRLPNGKLPRMDLWGHNPFSARTPDLKNPPLGGGNADFSDLDQLAHALDRHFKKAPLRRERHLKIFTSEFSAPTDHANFEFNFFVSRATQAAWIRRALRITRSYKRIATFGYLSLYDDPVRPDGDQVERGLITRSGEKKPAYNAFKNG